VIAGDLTLDAGSDPNAVFIFRMPTTFSTAADKKVILAGGANPKNIFWSAGTAATFAARCTMQGNIFAGTAITFAAGCTHHGRYTITHLHTCSYHLSRFICPPSFPAAHFTSN
jgi:hypothetical protein